VTPVALTVWLVDACRALDGWVALQLAATIVLAADGLVALALPVERDEPADPWVPGTYQPDTDTPDLDAWAAAIHHRWHIPEPTATVTRLPAPGGPRRREAA
jgi:hypothetical protein